MGTKRSFGRVYLDVHSGPCTEQEVEHRDRPGKTSEAGTAELVGEPPTSNLVFDSARKRFLFLGLVARGGLGRQAERAATMTARGRHAQQGQRSVPREPPIYWRSIPPKYNSCVRMVARGTLTLAE